jgi:hypothetical protein
MILAGLVLGLLTTALFWWWRGQKVGRINDEASVETAVPGESDWLPDAIVSTPDDLTVEMKFGN